MTQSLRFPGFAYEHMSAGALAEAKLESCAFAFTAFEKVSGTWLVQAHEQAPEAAYEHRTRRSAVLKTSYVVDIANRARLNGQAIVVAHTHPDATGFPRFSAIDDEGEIKLSEYFTRRAPAGPHLALVIGPEGCRARQLGGSKEVPVWQVGDRLALRSSANETQPSEHLDRQIRAFGAAGQSSISSLKIGVVGLGGTGSIVLQELAYLGARDLTLIDPDTIERTNLNRLVGSIQTDEGKSKADVAANWFLRINPESRVAAVVRDVVDSDVVQRLLDRDVIFLCTDSHASRAVVGQLAYQYLIPVIDMGVSITANRGKVTHITGRVQLLSPGQPCLVCTAALDGEQIRREMLTPEQRASDPYVIGAHEPQPSVISLNGTLSSLAVTMFLGLVTDVPAEARFQLYDGVRGTVRPTVARVVPTCVVCSASGSLAKGSAWPLPVRPIGGRSAG